MQNILGIIRVINFELVKPIRPRYINVTDGWTEDGRGRSETDVLRGISTTAALRCAALRCDSER